MTGNPLRDLADIGQSVWYDHFDRDMLEGRLQRLVEEDGLSGVTTNPAIFQKALEAEAYDGAIAEAVGRVGPEPERVYEALVVSDIRAMADTLRPVHEASAGADGLVSLELPPELAEDGEGTIREAERLYAEVDRPNAMIKVPGTDAGIAALEELTARGVPVNVTLLFDARRCRSVGEAYIRGLERRRRSGSPVSWPPSVASLFISRIDARVDGWLLEHVPERAERWLGRAAIANAQLAYSAFRDLFHGEAFAELRAAGARPQRLLWASTAVKGERYPATYYVDALAGPETVTTLPPATLEAYRRDGAPAARLGAGLDEAPAILESLRALGVDLDRALADLEAEGIEAFARAHQELLSALTQRIHRVAAA